MGVGCDEYGVCYAEAHGEPGRCPRNMNGGADNFIRLVSAVEDETMKADFSPEAIAKAERALSNWAMNNRHAIIALPVWRELADTAITHVKDAVRETNWGQPTFGLDYGEELRAEYDALLVKATQP